MLSGKLPQMGNRMGMPPLTLKLGSANLSASRYKISSPWTCQRVIMPPRCGTTSKRDSLEESERM